MIPNWKSNVQRSEMVVLSYWHIALTLLCPVTSATIFSGTPDTNIIEDDVALRVFHSQPSPDSAWASDEQVIDCQVVLALYFSQALLNQHNLLESLHSVGRGLFDFKRDSDTTDLSRLLSILS